MPFKAKSMGGDKGMGISGVGLKLKKDINFRWVEVLVKMFEGVVIVEGK